MTRVARRSYRHVKGIASRDETSYVGSLGTCAMPYKVAKDPKAIVQNARVTLDDSAGAVMS